MAENNIPESGKTKNPLGSIERRHLSLNASWEIESLIDCILKEVNSGDLDLGLDAEMKLRGLGCRVKEVNSIIMSALGDELESIKGLRCRLYGGSENVPIGSGALND